MYYRLCEGQCVYTVSDWFRSTSKNNMKRRPIGLVRSRTDRGAPNGAQSWPHKHKMKTFSSNKTLYGSLANL